MASSNWTSSVHKRGRSIAARPWSNLPCASLQFILLQYQLLMSNLWATLSYPSIGCSPLHCHRAKILLHTMWYRYRIPNTLNLRQIYGSITQHMIPDEAIAVSTTQLCLILSHLLTHILILTLDSLLARLALHHTYGTSYIWKDPIGFFCSGLISTCAFSKAALTQPHSSPYYSLPSSFTMSLYVGSQQINSHKHHANL